jgi:hypothetical protein
VPISDNQERWDIYVDRGTRETVRGMLAPGESLSEFVRTAVKRERARRARRARREEEDAA